MQISIFVKIGETDKGEIQVFEKISALFGKGAKAKELQTNRRIAEKLHDMPFKYISEKDENGIETILARGGHINLIGEKKNELCATAGTSTIFRLSVEQMKIWEFMSLDGCVISFCDLDTGKDRTVNVYYDAHLS